MTGFKPGSSGIGSNRSANCAQPLPRAAFLELFYPRLITLSHLYDDGKLTWKEEAFT